MVKRSLQRFSLVLLGAGMLLAMPVLNGIPTMFSDTRAYMSLGEAAVTKVWTESSRGKAAEASAPSSPSDLREQTRHALASAGARSPYFSVYLYVLATIGGMWLVVCVQALLTAAVIDIFYRALGLSSSRTYLLTMAALSALSTAPVFVSFMMPDVFAGLGAVAATSLIVRRKSTTRWEAVFLAALIGFSALVHSTHMVIIVGAAFGAAAVAATGRVEWRRTLAKRFCAILLLALLGPMGTYIYGIAAKAALGEEIYRPPFLTARLLEDGPGRAYLAESCRIDANAFELCKHMDRALTDSQAFLWDKGSPQGVFATADADARIRLSRDETRFVMGVLAYAPVDALKATLRNIGQLAVSLRVDDVTDTSAVYRDPEFRTLAPYVEGTQACVEDPDICAPRLPIQELGVMTGVAAWISLLIGLAGLFFPDVRARSAITGLWLAFAANVVICGAFSGPYARYETRMSWTLLLAACVVVALRYETGVMLKGSREAAPSAL